MFQINRRVGRTGQAAVLTALFLFSSCAKISVTHSPYYRAIPHDSTIQVTAESSRGISTIALTVTTGTMTDCSELGGLPSVIPCRTAASSIVHTCTFPSSPTTAVCEYTQSLGHQSMVSYQAVASGTGYSKTSPEITYAAGYPPTAWIARPIRWHRDDPMASKIDVGFFPDADYLGDYSGFTGDLETIITGNFFNTQNFAKVYTANRNHFNLWAAPFGADANGCSRTYNALITPVWNALENRAIVHRDYFRDCASISLGGSGSVYANAGDPDWIFAHEGGHFIHGQGDEYCCDGGYGTAGSCQNVWGSKAACENYANAHGFDPAQCAEIKSGTANTGKWRIDDGALETMKDRTDNSDWQNTSRACVLERFSSCASGSCY